VRQNKEKKSSLSGKKVIIDRQAYLYKSGVTTLNRNEIEKY